MRKCKIMQHKLQFTTIMCHILCLLLQKTSLLFLILRNGAFTYFSHCCSCYNHNWSLKSCGLLRSGVLWLSRQSINFIDIGHLAKYRTWYDVWVDALVNISKHWHALFLYQPFASECSDFIVYAYEHKSKGKEGCYEVKITLAAIYVLLGHFHSSLSAGLSSKFYNLLCVCVYYEVRHGMAN